MILGPLAVLLLALAAGCGDQGTDESAGADPAETADSTDTATTGPTATSPETTPPGETTPPAGTAPPTTAPPTTGPPLSTVPPPTITQPVPPPTGPSDQYKPITVTGQVVITGDCVDLLTSTVRWTLLGPAVATLQNGAQVEVNGLPAPEVLTPCGDSPMQVYEARPR